jgi:hypothetical protein
MVGEDEDERVKEDEEGEDKEYKEDRRTRRTRRMRRMRRTRRMRTRRIRMGSGTDHGPKIGKQGSHSLTWQQNVKASLHPLHQAMACSNLHPRPKIDRSVGTKPQAQRNGKKRAKKFRYEPRAPG